MLLHALRPTLCRVGLHDWRNAVGNDEVQCCTRCGATRVTLRPGRRIQIADVQLEMSTQDEQMSEKES
jgi:Zn finger protein HypA/HybF involved in hydrogenase expression